MTDMEKAKEWLEKMREWLKTFEGMPDEFQIDYNSETPSNAGLHPGGLIPVNLERDVTGRAVQEWQLNFIFHMVLEKVPDLDELSLENAAKILALQRWGVLQSLYGIAPKFGDTDQKDEQIQFSNGQLLSAVDGDAGLYAVNISVDFKEILQEDD